MIDNMVVGFYYHFVLQQPGPGLGDMSITQLDFHRGGVYIVGKGSKPQVTKIRYSRDTSFPIGV